jgi:hypothetical protein
MTKKAKKFAAQIKFEMPFEKLKPIEKYIPLPKNTRPISKRISYEIDPKFLFQHPLIISNNKST